MKNKIWLLVVIAFFIAGKYGLILAQTTGTQNYKEMYEQLKIDYDNLVKDRDNLLNQSRNLIQFKTRVRELEDQMNNLLLEKGGLEAELQARLAQNQMMQEKTEEAMSAKDTLEQDKASLKNYIEKMEIEYRIVNDTKKKIAGLTKENTDLLRKMQGSGEKINTIEKAKLDASAQAEVYRRQLKDTNTKFQEALEKNRSLEKKVEDMPKKFTELARENAILLKQTALMHYNLGVFYTQSKEFSRAIAEFEKGLELNPDDAYAHFNLGYIYAEQLADRSKAVQHFQQFLRLAKNDDKDVDWVKRYIITWNTWEGKKPVK